MVLEILAVQQLLHYPENRHRKHLLSTTYLSVHVTIKESEMYTCQICKKTVPPKTRAFRIPIETRIRQYPAREKVFLVRRNHQEKLVDDPGGTGREIVREVTACPDCVAVMKRQSG